ncbi:MAG TPA: 4-hydroxy-3-methylbut-2-en-1-yl diphosphate synthase [Clostridiales bacterium]|jgi:(E)-4-hydroxy-3-methylbut-2-enyl-diphosphate synthase|nr:4-hydroxy-3-methylbut-2-en-1-yl diphosphate synthase [Clostridiales bacterium]
MTKIIKYGDVEVGGDSLITVQSMTNTKTHDIDSTVRQIHQLEKNGCDITRVAVPDEKSAEALKEIKSNVNIPVIADIHFDYKLALKSVKSGADGIRINPGNIGSEEKVKKIVYTCREKNIPIRVGVNSGSVKKEYINKFKGVNEDSLVESALDQIRQIEKFQYNNIVVSIKSSNVVQNYKSNLKLSKLINYPIHLGVTESGTYENGIIKSSMGIGSLLMQGIGDTIRVSLTADPVEEVRVGRKMLQYLNLRPYGPNIISCPTCGRTEINIEKLSLELEKRIIKENIKTDITIAVMGCVVNGPGEAKEADIGIAGGKGEAILFKKGKLIKKIGEDNIVDSIIEEIKKSCK